jgi:hypothetical protein
MIIIIIIIACSKTRHCFIGEEHYLRPVQCTTLALHCKYALTSDYCMNLRAIYVRYEYLRHDHEIRVERCFAIPSLGFNICHLYLDKPYNV